MKLSTYQIVDSICTTTGSTLGRALGLKDGLQVILKLLDPQDTSSVRTARFRREYLLLQSLNVAEIAKPISLIEERDCLAMVMENFAGESLETVLASGRPMAVAASLTIASHLSRALAGLHAARIIHQDIRPLNIMVTPENQPRIMDLALAIAQGEDAASPGQRTLHAGDWAYMSPEQTGRMNRPLDCRTDFYSLGITLYRMLTGRLPFAASDPLEWAHCHIARTPPAPRDIAPAVPQPVSDIVMKLLAKLPEERYQSAHGLRHDIERCIAQWHASGCVESFPLGEADASERFQIPSRLYGRDHEIALLRAAFDGMAATGRAALVTISGYSGVGKSSLVHEVHKSIVAEHGYFISGKFDQYMRDIPYATLTQAFRAMVQQLLAESEASIAGWRHDIQEAVGTNGQLIINVLPQMEVIMGRQSAVPDLPPVEAQHRFRTVFRQFLGVFTRREHPLVLFLDDLQWIDGPSIMLIEHILSHADTRYLLLIGAYRDNEVDADHPLMTSVESIRNSGASVIDIKLAPLSVTHLNQLVADTLHVERNASEALTHQVFKRTEGNPFFFTQFLASLHQDGLFWHDMTDCVWKWDLGKIEARDFADNVVDLMVRKLRKLPVHTQDVLQLAACLGNKFDLHSLVLASGNPDVKERLAPAVQEGLLIYNKGSAKFLHDRIQQAAYLLIPEMRRDEMHLHIGRLLMKGLAADDLDEQIFDVVNQLNHGGALLVDPNEKAQVAELNLRAGRRAKASTAYPSACVYLAAGMALLDEEFWRSRYELTFNLWLERATCEFLNNNIETAERIIPELLPQAVSAIDKASVYHLQMQICEVKSEGPRAIDNVIEGLRLFGIELSAHPSREQVQTEYDRFWQNMGERSIESLLDLPVMTDPEMLAAMNMLSSLFGPAFFTDNNLVQLHLVHMANLTLKHGIAGASANGYAWLGMFLGPVFHRYADGYRFGKLAMNLGEKRGLVANKAKLYLAMGHVTVWTQPLKATIDFFRMTFRSGIESGDLAYACYSCNCLLTALLARGDQLDEVWRESEMGAGFARKVEYRDVTNIIVSQQHFIQSMRGRTLQTDQGSFDEAAFEARLGESRMATMVCWYWIVKLQIRFMAGDYEAAISAAEKAKDLLWSSEGTLQLLDYHYYAALTITAICENLPPARRGALRTQLSMHCAQLQEWAENASATFFDKHALVAAEVARIDGKAVEAMQLYEQAIQSARENGFVHNQGIAYELASAFYRMRGFQKIADTYLHEARNCFVRWGGDGKLAQLDERYPHLRAQLALPSAASLDGVAQLDVLSVAKASQAISGQIVLDELIDTLLRIMLENAGAQTGALILVRGDDMMLAARAGVTQQEVQVQLHLAPMAPELDLPSGILNYVRRSRTQVLLADAAEPHPFSTDPYLLRHQPKSVLCIPIVRQGTLTGLLYLENTLLTHAFTPQRVTVLELLAAQAAISLENALLYNDLRQENSERKRMEEILREREARIRRLMESNIIGIFFWDLHGGISEANDAFLHLTGYGREDLLCGRVRWAQMTPPEHLAADARAIEELRSSGACSPYEKEFVRKDDKRLPVLIGAALLEGSQENGVAFVLDLTERKRAETEQAARQAADAANRAKSTFLANISHELRTPLNGVLGYAQILRQDTTLNARQVAGVDVIRQSGEHLLTLINDILDIAKIEAGKLSLNPSDIRLTDFLYVITQIINVKATQKGLQFISDIAPDLPNGIRVDARLLRQVLLNLLANAIKFTDCGQVTLRVRCLSSGRLRFEVHDTGIGIREEEMKTIFQPFEQAGEMRRRFGGTGLGLAISREIVRLMDSEIRVDSRAGEGSTFWFELEVPVLVAEPAALPAELVVTGYEGPRKKVLVVDDIAENRAMLIDMLSPLGFEMVAAENGCDGVEKAQVLRPALILMDRVMPEMDGLEATRRLRQLPAVKDVPIIAISASASGSDETNCLLAGANAFLSKPIHLGQLLTQLADLLKLNWTYGSSQARSPERQPTVALLTPPEEEMNILHGLARLGNMKAIVRWANSLAERDATYLPFVSQLLVLAHGYQSRALLSMVERCLSEKKTGQ
ncbi:AAA family ATPase [Noviherbaspirillum aerium]|uniref:AAA family ATPase n=1 Tax=Noviherbaspirillum aerium TaxID=2588497 RepID=UPI00124F4268|nr:AAA family ATPase [Noviherbaspirillum aerium]